MTSFPAEEVATRSIGPNTLYLQLLHSLCAYIKPRNIFEIGCFRGASIAVWLSAMPEGAVVWACEPNPTPELIGLINQHPSRVVLHPVTSDRFFEDIDTGFMADIIFIDGEHSYEQTKKDFTNAMSHLAPGGVVVIHDTTLYAGCNRLIAEIAEGGRNIIHLPQEMGVALVTGNR